MKAEQTHILAYVLRYILNDKVTDTDHYEVFFEVDESETSTLKQAQTRRDELEQQYSDGNTELYSWNITLLVETLEHYPIAKPEKVFPNGFESWQETHFEVVDFITRQRMKSKITGNIGLMQEAQGTTGIWEMATSWTDEFEKLHEGDNWEDKDFYDEVEAFCKTKNKTT